MNHLATAIARNEAVKQPSGILMRVIDSLLRYATLLAIFTLVLGNVVLTRPAMADRPGTPNDAKLHWCPQSLTLKPRICGQFRNTASEDVHIELQFTKNGQPTPLPNMGCGIHTPPNTNCWTGERWPVTDSYDSTKPFRFSFMELDFGAEYCARFRARRASDAMVSQIWTGWACARTPPLPTGPPKTPQFTIEFVNAGRIAGKPNTDFLGVSYTDFEQYSSLRLSIKKAVGPDHAAAGGEIWSEQRQALHDMKEQLYPLTLDKTWLYVEVCAHNYVAKSCSHKVVSATAKVVLDPPPGGRPIKLTGAPRDPALQPNVDLPGMDYRSQQLIGKDDPEVCQQMCNNEDACKAWTWVKPAVQGPHAMCWLKKGAPGRAHSYYSVSGLKPGANKKPPVTFKFELQGKDYREVHTTIFWDCQALCEKESQCKAWSWVAPGVRGPKAMCSLKNDVPPLVANAKAASGLKGGKLQPPSEPPAATPNASSPAMPPPRWRRHRG